MAYLLNSYHALFVILILDLLHIMTCTYNLYLPFIVECTTKSSWFGLAIRHFPMSYYALEQTLQLTCTRAKFFKANLFHHIKKTDGVI